MNASARSCEGASKLFVSVSERPRRFSQTEESCVETIPRCEASKSRPPARPYAPLRVSAHIFNKRQAGRRQNDMNISKRTEATKRRETERKEGGKKEKLQLLVWYQTHTGRISHGPVS